ncbi:transposase [Streptomyces mirabilis]|uniref:transposase n=1 Tax=Streptomyces mirabilis TaxID=68239 RepID=UPI0034E948B2
MQWARIEPLLPDRSPRRGGRWRDHRQVIDAIAWKFQTGSQCVHLPGRVRILEGRLHPVAELGDRRLVGAVPHRPARPSRCRRRPGLGRSG